MLPFFSPWRLCILGGGGLFIIFISSSSTYSSIQDQGWNIIDTQQINDMVAPNSWSPSKPPLLGNIGIPDTTPGGGLAPALATIADGSSSDSEFATPTPTKQRSEIFNQDGILVQAGGGGSSGCPSSDNTRSSSLYPRSRTRARKDESMCPKPNFLLPRPPVNSGGRQEGEQDRTPFQPERVGDGDGQKNTGGEGGNRNGGDDEPSSNQPVEPPPAFVIPPDDLKLPYLFIPEVNRPKENSELCPDPMHPVPVCARPSDTYPISNSYSNNQLNIDPCYPYVAIVGCISVEGGRIGYCCSSAEVAYEYDNPRERETHFWEQILASEGEGEMLWEIQKALMAGLTNPFRLVGIACIPMGTTASGE